MHLHKSPESPQSRRTCALCLEPVDDSDVVASSECGGSTRAICVGCFATMNMGQLRGPSASSASVGPIASSSLSRMPRMFRDATQSLFGPAEPALAAPAGVHAPMGTHSHAAPNQTAEVEPERGTPARAYRHPHRHEHHRHAEGRRSRSVSPAEERRAAHDDPVGDQEHRGRSASITSRGSSYSSGPSRSSTPPRDDAPDQAALPGSRTTRCDWRQRCKFGLRCMFLHSPLEKQYFQAHPNGNPVWKTETCVNWKPHSHLECDFYHPGEDDEWCMRVGPNLRGNEPERDRRATVDRRSNGQRRRNTGPSWTSRSSRSHQRHHSRHHDGEDYPDHGYHGRRESHHRPAASEPRRAPPGFAYNSGGAVSPPREHRLGEVGRPSPNRSSGRADRASSWRRGRAV